MTVAAEPTIPDSAAVICFQVAQRLGTACQVDANESWSGRGQATLNMDAAGYVVLTHVHDGRWELELTTDRTTLHYFAPDRPDVADLIAAKIRTAREPHGERTRA